MTKTPDPELTYALVAGTFLGLMLRVKKPEDLSTLYAEFRELQVMALEAFKASKQREVDERS